MPNFSEVIQKDLETIKKVKSAVEEYEPIRDLENTKTNKKILNQLKDNLYLGFSKQGNLILVIVIKNFHPVNLEGIDEAINNLNKHFEEEIIPVYVCEDSFVNLPSDRIEDKFKLSVDEVNDIFEMIGENQRLVEIEQTEDNSEIVEELDGLCFGINSDDDYVLVVGCRDPDSLNYKYINKLANKLQNHFNDHITVAMISEDIIDEYAEKSEEEFNRTLRYKNGNVSKSLIDLVNNFFDDLKIEDKLVEIERSKENKEILDKIGKSFVTLTESGECRILEFADDCEIDGIQYQDLADELHLHFNTPVKAIILSPSPNDSEKGLFITTIHFF